MQADAATLASVDAIFSRVVRDGLGASAPRYDDGRCTSWRGRDERPGRLGRHRLLQLRPHPARSRRERPRAVALRLRADDRRRRVDGRLARRSRSRSATRSAGQGDRAGELGPAGDPAQPRDRRGARALRRVARRRRHARAGRPRDLRRDPGGRRARRLRLPAAAGLRHLRPAPPAPRLQPRPAQALQLPAERDDVPPRRLGGGRRLQPQRPRLRGLGPVARHRRGRLHRPRPRTARSGTTASTAAGCTPRPRAATRC